MNFNRRCMQDAWLTHSVIAHVRNSLGCDHMQKQVQDVLRYTATLGQLYLLQQHKVQSVCRAAISVAAA